MKSDAGQSELEPGSALDSYIVESTLGRGGMGVVYRARQYDLKRPAALKVIDPTVAATADMRDRFMREAQAAASIEHAHVLPIYSIGESGGVLYIAMRLIEEGDLQARIEAGIDVDRALEIVAQIAGALDAAHAAGLVHRDVKPQNILVAKDADKDHAYLTDFGLARQIADAGLTLPGAVVGTPWYMSPEQALGKTVDARTDVYALGCVLYEALTGEVPFPKDSTDDALRAQIEEPPPGACKLNPALPEEIDTVFKRALAKDPDSRYPSAGDLATAARAAFFGAPSQRPERSVATGAAAPVHDRSFPDPISPLYIQSQAPDMAPSRFEEFLDYLSDRGWSSEDLRELVLPWAPDDWSERPDSAI